MKLNLGCGHNYREGYVNVDNDPDVKTDWCGDACNMSYGDDYHGRQFDPWIDRFDEILANHSLEHFPDLFKIVDEMARVSKDGAVWYVNVPYCTWTQGWGNPHHINPTLFHENTFRFFDKGPEGIHKRRKQDYSIETIEVTYGYNMDFGTDDDTFEEMEYNRKHYLNAVQEINFILKVHK